MPAASAPLPAVEEEPEGWTVAGGRDSAAFGTVSAAVARKLAAKHPRTRSMTQSWFRWPRCIPP